MLLYEHEAKEIFSKAGISVPTSVLIESPDEVSKSVQMIGCPLVIKGQILKGGRGKAGLVETANNPIEAQQKADAIFESKHDYGPIKKVLVEKEVEGVQEVYMGITIDRLAKKPIVIICAEGGVEIEQIASKSPEKIFSLHVEPLRRLRFYEAVELSKKMEMPKKMLSAMASILMKLYTIFETYDAELVEINPLILTQDDRIYAVDAKMILNDDALYRHREFKETDRGLNAAEKKAKSMGITYVDLRPGNVAIISSGAGYTLMVIDLLRSLGGKPANFMDSIVDSREKMQRAIEFTIERAEEDSYIRSILMLKTMSFTPLDRMMGAIKDALKGRKSPVPIVSCLRATGNAVRDMSMKEAERELRELGIMQFQSLRDAVKKAVEISQEK